MLRIRLVLAEQRPTVMVCHEDSCGLRGPGDSAYLCALPPLDAEKEIVAAIDGYQKIIDGARQVVENYHYLMEDVTKSLSANRTTPQQKSPRLRGLIKLTGLLWILNWWLRVLLNYNIILLIHIYFLYLLFSITVIVTANPQCYLSVALPFSLAWSLSLKSFAEDLQRPYGHHPGR